MPPDLKLVHGYRPHDAVVLGIDPASRSGWSLFVRGKLIGSGVVESTGERLDVLQMAAEVFTDEGLPFVVVAETWSPGSWKSWNAIAAVHEPWGRWSEQLELIGCSLIVRVLVNEWRRDLYGKNAVSSMPRKMAKMLAKQRVKSVYKKTVSDDEAEAILIGEWGCRAGAVAAAIAA